MTLKDHREQLRAFLGDTTRRDQAALRVSSDLIALRQLAIQESGYGRDGDFSDYVPPYAIERQKEGYQTQYKDYTRTGELFRSVLPQIESSDATTTVVSIDARDQANKNKLRGAFRKDGRILDPTDDELQLAGEDFRQLRIEHFNNPNG